MNVMNVNVNSMNVMIRNMLACRKLNLFIEHVGLFADFTCQYSALIFL